VLIDGPTHFSGAEIVCPPALRPAVVLLIAMLASKGRSVLRSTYVIHRGYEDLAERLNELGANIETFRDI
jgi:UDP-N-acetylglucosamine 1-carboxyvinyltransferase